MKPSAVAATADLEVGPKRRRPRKLKSDRPTAIQTTTPNRARPDDHLDGDLRSVLDRPGLEIYSPPTSIASRRSTARRIWRAA
jgi:hypothetical protein